MITDPHNGLIVFQKAIHNGTIKPKRCKIRRELYFLRDRPTPDTIRMTYSIILGRQVKAVAVYMEEEPLDGKRVFSVGYAVGKAFRGEGLAKEILTSSFEEFSALISKGLNEAGFYLEAIVGVDNEISKSVAKQVFTDAPNEVIDGASGLPALHYLIFIP